MGINVLPQVIFFDAAGTLIHLPKGVAHHYRQVARRWSIELDQQRVDLAFKQAWKELPPPLETGCARPDDDKGWWRALVRQVFDRCDVPNECWREGFFDELYEHFAGPDVWELYADVLPVLEKLRHAHRLGIISNWDGRLRRVLAHLGIADWFDPVVISSEHGSDKPAQRLFHRALELAGVEPVAAMHVGDDPECDWRGAAAVGMAVFELKRPENGLEDLFSRLRGAGVTPR
jgi:putative hydrolase of the HAD superfamily